MRRHRLGCWSTRGGNTVDVIVQPSPMDDPLLDLVCEWDHPVSEADTLDYYERILPAIAERAREMLDRKRPNLLLGDAAFLVFG